MNENIDKSITRKMFTHEAANPPAVCPQCGAQLVQDFGPYLVATRSDRRWMDEFVTNGPFGYLCPECPTAVIHFPELSNMFDGIPAQPDWEVGAELTVLGVLDLDAAPPGKENEPLELLLPYVLTLFELDEAPDSDSKPVDTSIERTLYFAGEERPPKKCPECKRPLLLDYGPYLVRRIRRWRGDEEYALAGPFGWLCPGCATVVIHVPELVETMEDALGDMGDKINLTVLGRFNLEDVPPELAHLPPDELPPEFLVWYPHASKPMKQRKKRPRKPKPKRRKRRK